VSSLFIYYENHTKSTVIKKKRLKIHWSTLNAHWRHAEKPFRFYGVYTRLPCLSNNSWSPW